MTFIISIVISGIVALIIYNAALNNDYSPQNAFNYGIVSFFVLLLIFYGLISVVINR